MDDEPLDFGRLFVHHQGRIYGYIRGLVADRHHAEEILQDTASVLWRKFGDFRPGSDFLAWSLAVARLCAKEHQRKVRPALPLDDALATSVAEDTVALQSRLSDLRDALAGCLEKLKQRDRELFQRRYAADVTVPELAEQLARPVSTVYNALARIRRSLLGCISRRLSLDGERVWSADT